MPDFLINSSSFMIILPIFSSPTVSVYLKHHLVNIFTKIKHFKYHMINCVIGDINMDKSYAEIMKSLRIDNDYTQQQIAEILDTSQTMYARYERGASELPIRHLIALSKFYGVSTDYLLGLSKSKK